MTSILKKTLFTIGLLIALDSLVFGQCSTVNPELNDKIRFLGTWQSNGYPNYLEPEKDTISAEIKNFINTALPESVNAVNSGYFDENLKSNTEIIDTTDIFLTFVHEGAAWKNVLGFYTYNLNSPPTTFSEIDSMTIVFPFVDQNTLFKGGEKVKLGTFLPNTGIGYFLMTKAWTGDTICLDNRIVYTDKELNTFTTEEYRQHTILLNHEDGKRFLLGIEDQPRPSGDKDFNDAVFYITSSNPGAIDTTDLPKVPIAILSGDTVLCDENDIATLTLDLQGTPPFTVVYNNGVEDVEINEISSSPFTFETSVKGLFTLVSVQDAHGMGIVKGEANVVLNNLSADFVNDTLIVCEGTATSITSVIFNGYPPYSLTYTVDGNEITLDNILENTIDITFDPTSTLILTEVSDKYCTEVLSDELFIDLIELPSATITVTDTTLCEGELANIEVEFTGAAPFSFTYAVNGVEKTVLIDEFNYVIPIESDAIVEAMTVSSGSCIGTAEGTANVNFNPNPTVELVKPAIQCNVEENVQLTLNFTGTGPFEYSYNVSGNEFTSTTNGSDIIDLSVNDVFKLIAFNDQLCTGVVVDSLHTFENYANPEAEIISDEVIACANEKAQILIELRGLPPFTFVISNGTISETVTTNQFNYTYETDADGVFTITSIENENCSGTSTGSATVVKVDAPQVDVTFPNTDCDATGVAIIKMNLIGTAPFTYSYLIDEDIHTVTSGTNEVEIEVGLGERFELISFNDANCDGNVQDDEFVFYNYEATTAIIQSGDQFLCEIGDIATIEILLSGTFPITFEISNGQTSEIITTSNSLYTYETSETGVYEIISVTNGICDGVASGSASVTLYDEKPTLDVEASSNLFCPGGSSNLHFEFTGNSPWTFTLKNGDNQTEYISTESSLDVEVNEPGLYEIINFSDAYCSNSVSKNIEIGYFEQPTAAISGGGQFCGNEETVSIEITFTGLAPFMVTYTNGQDETTVSSDESSIVFETNLPGTYSLVSVSDANCTGTTSGEAIVVNLVDELEGEITGPENSCEGESINLVFTSNTTYNSIVWNTTGTGQINNGTTNEIEYIPGEGETGEVNFEAIITTDCGDKSFEYTLEIIETPSAEFTISPEELFSDSEILFEGTDENATSFTWEFGDGQSANGNPITHTYGVGGEYTVTLTVENKGCENDGSQTIEIKSINQLYVPNVFNPNALNTENKVVKVYGTNVSEDGFTFKIVNRWGNTMYQTNSFTEANTVGWDGREFNNNEDQSLSAFTWVLKGKFNDGEPFERTGTVTLLQ